MFQSPLETGSVSALGHFGHVKENVVMSLKLTKVRGHTCHLCIEKYLRKKVFF